MSTLHADAFTCVEFAVRSFGSRHTPSNPWMIWRSRLGKSLPAREIAARHLNERLTVANRGAELGKLGAASIVAGQGAQLIEQGVSTVQIILCLAR